MFIRNVMTANTVAVHPKDTARKVYEFLKERKFEGVPVLADDKIVGIVTMWDLLEKSAGEANCGLDTLSVEQVMSSTVITINQDEIIEEAAFLMHKHDIDIMPVVDDYDNIVGVISQGDLFRVFVQMMGLQSRGTRIALSIEDKVGQLAEIAQIIKAHGISIASIATFEPRHNFMDVVVRLKTTDAKKVVDSLRKAGFKITHVSQVWE